MKLLVTSLLTLLMLASCADPRYVDGPQTDIDTVTGCGHVFKSENLCLKTAWVQRPSESTYGEMTLSFVDVNDETRLVDPKNEPFIVLWMPSMGHGSSPVTMERIDVGRYKASEIFFIMPGPWDIRYQLKSGSDVVEERIQKITI